MRWVCKSHHSANIGSVVEVERKESSLATASERFCRLQPLSDSLLCLLTPALWLNLSHDTSILDRHLL